MLRARKKPRGQHPSDRWCKLAGRAIAECLMLNAHRRPDAFEDGAELEIRLRVESADGRYPVQVVIIDQLLAADEDDPEPVRGVAEPEPGDPKPEPGDVQAVATLLQSELADLRTLRAEREQREQRAFIETRTREEQQRDWRRRSEGKRSGAR